MINIAIDGTTSSGKSTLSEELAKKIGFKRFDSGAIYRAIACHFDKSNIKIINEKTMANFAKTLKIEVEFRGDSQRVSVNGVDETPNLRTEKISLLTSRIAPFKEIREKVISIQREFAKNNDCVMEGRDISTVVLPEADLKIFVTATAEERARRRYLQHKNEPGAPTYDEVLENLRLRDQRDENRKFGRLEIASDAIVIDTTGKTLEQVTEICCEIIKQKLNIS